MQMHTLFILLLPSPPPPLGFSAQVQQNVYAALLRMHYGVDCKRMFLVQLHPTLSTWAEHEVPDLREEVGRILEERAAEIHKSRSACK